MADMDILACPCGEPAMIFRDIDGDEGWEVTIMCSDGACFWISEVVIQRVTKCAAIRAAVRAWNKAVEKAREGCSQ